MGKLLQSTGKQIATQSQLKLTLDWATSTGKELTLKELVSITNVLTEYVEYGYSKEIADRLEKIEDYLNE